MIAANCVVLDRDSRAQLRRREPVSVIGLQRCRSDRDSLLRDRIARVGASVLASLALELRPATGLITGLAVRVLGTGVTGTDRGRIVVPALDRHDDDADKNQDAQNDQSDLHAAALFLWRRLLLVSLLWITLLVSALRAVTLLRGPSLRSLTLLGIPVLLGPVLIRIALW